MTFAVRATSLAGRVLPFVRGRLLVLIYHRVRAVSDEMFPDEATSESFEWQMALIARYCNPVALSEAVPMLQSGSLPNRAVAVTFDDGYQDNARVALPILQKYGMRATFFVATSFLNGGIMWNDRIIESVRSSGRRRLSFPDLNLTDYSAESAFERRLLAETLIAKVKHLAPPERDRQVDQVVVECEADLPRNLMMTDDEVRLLHSSGMEIGAHTRTHPILRMLSTDAAQAEISGSKDDLQKLLGAPVTAFAYPNGRPDEDYGARERELVAQAGFQYAPSTRWGVAHAGSDPFQLPRFTPWDSDPARWLARLLLQYRCRV